MGGIRLRPHHLLCIQGFRGQGYSPTFIANLAQLQEMLNELPETVIEIVAGDDDICSFCPHLDEEICIRPGQQVNELDGRILQKLELTEGDIATWGEFVDGVRENIDPEAVAELCQGCSWLYLGFCVEGVARLGQGHNQDYADRAHSNGC